MSHTRHLSIYEDLAYRRLLDFYFLHEQPIKHRDAARQIGMRDHEEDVLTVLNEFFLSTEDGFVNARANKEIMEFKVHQATSAYGAFIRDNPSLKQFVLKDVYIQQHTDGTIGDYIAKLRSHGEAMMCTSSTHDATNNHKPITNNHKPIKNTATIVAPPYGVSDSVWQEFVSHRKSKKAKVTQLVIDGIIKEAQLAGWTIEDALKEIIIRNWQSFKADWVKDESLSKTAQMNKRVISGLTRGLFGGDKNVKFIEN
jgi:uncharacterized protein YdaU (DUF1376 family)